MNVYFYWEEYSINIDQILLFDGVVVFFFILADYLSSWL